MQGKYPDSQQKSNKFYQGLLQTQPMTDSYDKLPEGLTIPKHESSRSVFSTVFDSVKELFCHRKRQEPNVDYSEPMQTLPVTVYNNEKEPKITIPVKSKLKEKIQGDTKQGLQKKDEQSERGGHILDPPNYSYYSNAEFKQPNQSGIKRKNPEKPTELPQIKKSIPNPAKTFEEPILLSSSESDLEVKKIERKKAKTTNSETLSEAEISQCLRTEIEKMKNSLQNMIDERLHEFIEVKKSSFNEENERRQRIKEKFVNPKKFDHTGVQAEITSIIVQETPPQQQPKKQISEKSQINVPIMPKLPEKIPEKIPATIKLPEMPKIPDIPKQPENVKIPDFTKEQEKPIVPEKPKEPTVLSINADLFKPKDDIFKQKTPSPKPAEKSAEQNLFNPIKVTQSGNLFDMLNKESKPTPQINIMPPTKTDSIQNLFAAKDQTNIQSNIDFGKKEESKKISETTDSTKEKQVNLVIPTTLGLFSGQTATPPKKDTILPEVAPSKPNLFGGMQAKPAEGLADIFSNKNTKTSGIFGQAMPKDDKKAEQDKPKIEQPKSEPFSLGYNKKPEQEKTEEKKEMSKVGLFGVGNMPNTLFSAAANAPLIDNKGPTLNVTMQTGQTPQKLETPKPFLSSSTPNPNTSPSPANNPFLNAATPPINMFGGQEKPVLPTAGPAPGAPVLGGSSFPTGGIGTGLFNAPAPNPSATNLFGAPNPTPSIPTIQQPIPAGPTNFFGSATPNAPPQLPANPPTNLFGALAPTTGIFGPSATPSGGIFGQNTQGSSIFGGAPSGPNLLGTPQSNVGLFGNPSPTSSQASPVFF